MGGTRQKEREREEWVGGWVGKRTTTHVWVNGAKPVVESRFLAAPGIHGLAGVQAVHFKELLIERAGGWGWAGGWVNWC